MQRIDDPEYDRLTKAAERVQQRLADAPKSVRRYSVALLDEALPDDDPTLDEIEGDIEVAWVTFRAKFPERPVAILRAVGLQGLAAFVEIGDNPEAIHIAWLSASTPLERTPLGTAGDLLRKRVRDWGEASERAAEKDWELAEEFSLPTDAKIGRIAFEKTDPTAFGISPGQALTPEATAPVIDAALENLAVGASQNAAALKKALFLGLKLGLAKIAESQKRRLSLLWWRQTLYSPSRRIGYRTITSPASRVFALASDLEQVLPDMYPQSVEYLLREVVAEAVTETDGWDGRVAGFAQALMADPDAVETLRERGGQAGRTSRGRVPLLSFLIEVAQGTAVAEDAPLRLGLPAEAEWVSAADMAVWLLREFAADTLAVAEEEE